jgi:hypothetical protein
MLLNVRPLHLPLHQPHTPIDDPFHGKSQRPDIIGALRLVGYDYVISVEYEDPLMSIGGGLVFPALYYGESHSEVLMDPMLRIVSVGCGPFNRLQDYNL